MSWSLLNDVLKNVAKYETQVGKVWLSVLLIFRLLVLVAVADKVYSDEQKEFECNTRQPGCKTVCYDAFFPVSHIRFWAIQLVLVSTPTMLVLMHVAARRFRNKFKGREDLDKMEGGLVWTYQLSVICRVVVEVGSAYLFWRFCSPLGLILPMVAQCSVAPCPNSVDCFVSRPSEKTVFIIFMLTVSGICLFLNLIELFYIPIKYWLAPLICNTRQNVSLRESPLSAVRSDSTRSAPDDRAGACCSCRCDCTCHPARGRAELTRGSSYGGGSGGSGGGGCGGGSRSSACAGRPNGVLPGRCVVVLGAQDKAGRKKKGVTRMQAIEMGDGDGGGGGGGFSPPPVSPAASLLVSPRAPYLATHGKCRSCGEEVTGEGGDEEEQEEEEEVGDRALLGAGKGGRGKEGAVSKERRAGSVGDGK
uniref:Gap junction protein n=1 Tax=Petromyzon marinus TaxID=7757 RepID=A0AAJ7UD62_PETMA|nr:gap junction beta-3 protein-like [Petromyzon marinus]